MMRDTLDQPCEPLSKEVVWRRLGSVLADAHSAGIGVEEFMSAVAESALDTQKNAVSRG
jgi:hypothetical protein